MYAEDSNSHEDAPTSSQRSETIKKRWFLVWDGILFLLIIAVIAVGVGAFSGCVSEPVSKKYVKDGKTYGVVRGSFRHRWWNYYERALSFAEGEFYEEAAADLKLAIKQREKDQRSARTYGMHFVDYFPHRELGVVYYYQEKFDDAEKELQFSLDAVDTGKAKHYLNLVRKAKLEISKLDQASPTITMKAGVADVTNHLQFEIKGEVEDDKYARKIVINDTPEFIELSAPKIAFAKKIKLKKGLNEITIKTADLLGKETEKKIKVVGDFEGPAFRINNLVDGDRIGTKRVVLNGALADATGVTTLKINNQVLAYNKEREIEFAMTVELEEGSNQILLAATDVAGNTTTGELNLTYIPQLALQDHILDHKPIEPTEPILLAMTGTVTSDAGMRGLYSAAKSKAAFRLRFKDLTATQTVYYDTLFVDGSATGTNTIESVSINDEPLLILPGRTVYFNQLMELQEGENSLTIEVTDSKGHSATKTVQIIRKIPKVHQIGSRMSLAILPFEIKGQTSMASEVVYDNLIDAFIEQDRFHIVTRGAELEAVLREQKLSQTDLVDKGTAVRVGQLVAAEGIIMGTIRETADAIEIYARLVNTETSSIMEAKDVYSQDKDLSQIQYLTNGLALKLKHSFPLIEGLVIQTKGTNIYADFGSFKSIKKEMRFIVFRQGQQIVHPVTGKVLGSETEELGVATVVEVYEDMSIGKLIADFDPRKISVKDLVITK